MGNCGKERKITVLGVDACNTALGALIFAAAMNLGQSWATVLTLFGCRFPGLYLVIASFSPCDCTDVGRFSRDDVLCPDLG